MKIYRTLLLSPALIAFFIPAAQANNFALFGLYQDNAQVQSMTALLQQHTSNCQLRREGPVTESFGNLKLPAANRFFLFACDSALLEQSNSTKITDTLNAQVNNLILLEGPLPSEAVKAITEQGSEHSYFFKFSHYKAANKEQRNKDLKTLSTLAAQRPLHFKTEANIAISHSYGIEKPDELTVVYYQTKGDGKKYRSQNPDILEKIGAFNLQYLTKFSYIPASSNL